MARNYKFDDCGQCRFRNRPDVCAQCDYGEQFEDASIRELNFENADRAFDRASLPLVTEDDEPGCNPDDLIKRLSNEGEDGDDD